MSDFDPRDFRRALGKFATGVTVITTGTPDGELLGMTANSFSSVSIDPPLILWSVEKSAHGAETYRSAEFFGVNVLGENQVETSNRFARKGEDKFTGEAISSTANNVPMIDHSAAQIDCRTWATYDGGDHWIIVGEVLNYRYEEAVSSLVFHNGRYAVSEMHPTMRDSGQPIKREGGVLDDYLLFLLRQALSSYCHQFYPKLNAFNITAEGWRVLTLLADTPSMPRSEIGQLVFQPPRALADTLYRLEEKKLITQESEQVTLTDHGSDLAKRLLAMALENEKDILKDLEDETVAALKTGLSAVIQAVAK